MADPKLREANNLKFETEQLRFQRDRLKQTRRGHAGHAEDLLDDVVAEFEAECDELDIELVAIGEPTVNRAQIRAKAKGN